MKKDTALKPLYEAYERQIASLNKDDPSFHDLQLTVRESLEHYLFQKARQESKMFDETWVKAIDECIPHLDKIIKNPRNFIKEQGEVVLAALAKRVGPSSISHLASHTQYIRKINNDGSIQPEKILAVNTEEDFQIYENRFVMSLVNKLIEFVDRRYNFIRDHLDTRDSELLVIHSVTQIEDLKYEVDTRVKVSKPSDDGGNRKKNDELLAKIDEMRHQIRFYKTSRFMKEMQGARPVRNPINMTNMIVKHPDYKACYKLWTFLDKYDRLGVSFSVNEQNADFTPEYLDQLYSMVLAQMLTLRNNVVSGQLIPATHETDHTITPKIKLSLEDETFLDRKFAYHEFPLLEKVDKEKAEEEKKRIEEGRPVLPKSPETIREEEDKAAGAAYEEDANIQVIANHEAELAREQEIKEAAERAKIRKELERRFTLLEEDLAYKAKKMMEDDLKKAAAAKKKAEENALLQERKLLAAQRRRVKDEAVKDRRIDVIHSKQLESKRKKVAKLAEIEGTSPVNNDAPAPVSTPETPNEIPAKGQRKNPRVTIIPLDGSNVK